MRNIFSLVGILFLLLTLACGNGSEAEKPPLQTVESLPVASTAEPAMWPLLEMEAREFDGKSLTLPIRVFQGPEFPTLDALDGKSPVTFTKAPNGLYYGYIGGIGFILQMN